MFRRWLNRAAIHIAISPRGPILIKSGLESADPTRPGMEFVRTRHPLHGEAIYLPGTSLKGAMRSQAERVLRGLGFKEVCNPFDPGSTCRRPPSTSSDSIFKSQCPACQTFGSLKVAGRCNIEDAYPWDRSSSAATTESPVTETRSQVGIDRRTGQAQTSALFDLEVAVAGTFHTTIHLENFQLWQLGLIGALLEDMNHGDLPIGFGKSRGLGQVGVKVGQVEIDTLGRDGRGLRGAGALCPKAEADRYGLAAEDRMDLLAGVVPAATWRGQRIAVEDKAAQGLLAAVVAGPLSRWVEARAPAGGRR